MPANNSQKYRVESRDSNGTVLGKGDSVTLIKDLKVKRIHLTDDPAEVGCRVEKVKGLVLRTEFLKTA